MRRRKEVVEFVCDIIGILAMITIFVVVKLLEMNHVNCIAALIVGLISCFFLAVVVWIVDYLEN